MFFAYVSINKDIFEQHLELNLNIFFALYIILM